MSGSVWISGWRSSDETLFSDLQLGGNRWKQSAMFSERAEGLRAAMYSRFWYRLSTGRPWTQSQLFLSQTIHLALDHRNLVLNIEYDDVHRVISCVVRLYLVPLGRPHVVSDSGTSHICLLLRCWCCLGNINLIMIFSCEIHYARAVVQSLSQFDFLTRNKNGCKPAIIINQLLNTVAKW